MPRAKDFAVALRRGISSPGKPNIRIRDKTHGREKSRKQAKLKNSLTKTHRT
jgi:hypothetical protein